ncbi:hypothetical protein AB6Q85_003308 [Vibrio cholerae]
MNKVTKQARDELTQQYAQILRGVGFKESQINEAISKYLVPELSQKPTP